MMKIKFIIPLLLMAASVFAADSLKLEDVWGSGYGNYHEFKVYGVRSTNDGEHFTQTYNGENGFQVIKQPYSNGDVYSILFDQSRLGKKASDLAISAYQLNSEENMMLLSIDEEPIYRHSTKAHFYLYEMESKSFIKVNSGDDKVSYATFSPNGKKVAFVRLNNLYVYDIESKEETQVTFDGQYNQVINGSADWVYEEEFAFARAFFWSPSSEQIAYYRFDESEVKEFGMDMFNSLYPENYKFKYPKAGEKNSKVQIKVYNVRNKASYTVQTGEEKDNYIPRIKWTKKENTLLVYRMNRHQNHLELLKVHTIPATPRNITLNAELMYEEKSKTYIDVSDDITFLNENEFIWTSDKDGFKHIYLNDLNGGSKQITKGNFVVTAYYGIDDDKNIYYQAAKRQPYQREVYRISINGEDDTILTKEKGVSSAKFSKRMKYYIKTYSNANTPAVITIHEGSSTKKVVDLVDNNNTKENLKDLNLNDKEFFDFDTQEGVHLYGFMIKPKDFSKKKKYPVYMYQYSGPNSQSVMDSYGGRDYLWHQFLAQQGYLVVCVDGRGTGARGVDFQKCTYMELGKLETVDQIATAQYLKTLSFVDGDNIGIQGWSFGGYMASLCITKGADDFKSAIAVAPVTNWRYYDSIYTERYMRTPQENASGYDDNSPINHMDKLKGNYLLIHGSADDNVHYQNTMEMIQELVDQNKQFDLFIYPNKNHGIYGGNTRLHLFTKMYQFCEETLK